MNTKALPGLSALTILLGALLFVTVEAHATAGFAEWEVKTPGGHFICHTDPYLEKYKVWLSSDCQGEQALIERLQSWRYFEGFILGEAAQGKFVFDETKHEVVWLDAGVTFEAEVSKRKLVAITDWLTPGDGYAEGWFTPRTWKLCRFRLGLEPAGSKPMGELSTVLAMPPMEPFSPTVEGCRELMKRVDGYYRRTVLKRWCEEYKRSATQEMLGWTTELCGSVKLSAR